MKLRVVTVCLLMYGLMGCATSAFEIAEIQQESVEWDATCSNLALDYAILTNVKGAKAREALAHQVQVQWLDQAGELVTKETISQEADHDLTHSMDMRVPSLARTLRITIDDATVDIPVPDPCDPPIEPESTDHGFMPGETRNVAVHDPPIAPCDGSDFRVKGEADPMDAPTDWRALVFFRPDSDPEDPVVERSGPVDIDEEGEFWMNVFTWTSGPYRIVFEFLFGEDADEWQELAVMNLLVRGCSGGEGGGHHHP